MSDATLAFNILTKYKDSGADAARRDMDGLSKSGSRTAAVFKKVGVAAAFGLAGGVVLAGKALIGATQSAIEDEAAQKRLALALKNNAGATNRQVASTEKWITAQGKAYGVTDDDLRPALGRLVTATHSVSEAQKLASLAMDVSAGTGKSLKQVTEALMKAQNGQIIGLSRLGLKTQDTTKDTAALQAAQISARGAQSDYTDAVSEFGAGSEEARAAAMKLQLAQTRLGDAQSKTKKTTIDFDTAVKRLGDQFGGQAAKGAQTLEGKMARLKVQWDEGKEAVGAKLIPALSTLADIMISRVIPAVGQTVKEMRNGQGAAGVLGNAIRVIGNVTVSTGKFLNDHRSVILAIVGAYITYKTTLVTVAVTMRIMAIATAVSTAATAVHTAATAANQSLLMTWIGVKAIEFAAWTRGAAAIVASTVATVAHTAVIKAVAVATKMWAAGQWLLNVALTANPIGLVVVAIAALVAGVIYAYKHFDGFRKVVDKTFSFLKGAVVATIGFVKSHWQLIGTILLGPIFLAAVQIAKHWGKIKSIVMGGISAVIGFVKAHWVSILVTLIAGPFGLAVSLVVRNWGRITGAVSAGVGRVVGYMKSLPGRILGALGALDSLLYNAGKDIIYGLLNGLRSMWGELMSLAGSIANSIKDKISGALHIHSPSRVMHVIGIAIMDGLIGGIDDGRQKLATVLGKVIDQVKASGDKLKGLLADRQSFATGFRSFSSSVFGQDFTDPNTGESTATAAGLVAAQQAERVKAKALKMDVRRLVKMGLSKDLIRQMSASGEAGIANIHALAQGTAGQVHQFNALNASTAHDLTAAGMTAGNELYGAAIKDARKDERLAKAIAHELRRFAHERDRDPGKVEVIVRTPSGREIQRQLLEIKRKTGHGLGFE